MRAHPLAAPRSHAASRNREYAPRRPRPPPLAARSLSSRVRCVPAPPRLRHRGAGARGKTDHRSQDVPDHARGEHHATRVASCPQLIAGARPIPLRAKRASEKPRRARRHAPRTARARAWRRRVGGGGGGGEVGWRGQGEGCARSLPGAPPGASRACLFPPSAREEGFSAVGLFIIIFSRARASVTAQSLARQLRWRGLLCRDEMPSVQAPSGNEEVQGRQRRDKDDGQRGLGSEGDGGTGASTRRVSEGRGRGRREVGEAQGWVCRWTCKGARPWFRGKSCGDGERAATARTGCVGSATVCAGQGVRVRGPGRSRSRARPRGALGTPLAPWPEVSPGSLLRFCVAVRVVVPSSSSCAAACAFGKHSSGLRRRPRPWAPPWAPRP